MARRMTSFLIHRLAGRLCRQVGCDTLVIDVIGFNDKTWIDRIGHPHSDGLHVTERLRRVNHDTLTDEIRSRIPRRTPSLGQRKLNFQLKPVWLLIGKAYARKRNSSTANNPGAAALRNFLIVQFCSSRRLCFRP